MTRVRLVALLAACATLLGACTTVVSGSGSNGLAGRSPRPTPTAPVPAQPQARPTGCPHVRFAAAHLSFDCITGGMQASYNGSVWPVTEYKTVEPQTSTNSGWILEEGAGHWGSPQGTSLADIAANVRQQMLNAHGYGAAPIVHTVADRDMTIDGHAAHLLQTTVTINPAWARQDGTKVKQERLWIIAIEVAADDVSLWYTSLPDLASALWPKVPATIASIRVG